MWELIKTLGFPCIWNCYQYCNFYNTFWRGSCSGKSLSNIVLLGKFIEKPKLEKGFLFFLLFSSVFTVSAILTKSHFWLSEDCAFFIVLRFSSCSLTYLYFTSLNKEPLVYFLPSIFIFQDQLRFTQRHICCVFVALLWMPPEERKIQKEGALPGTDLSVCKLLSFIFLRSSLGNLIKDEHFVLPTPCFPPHLQPPC